MQKISADSFVIGFLSNNRGKKIFIWGHSLGTGVTSRLSHVLSNSNSADKDRVSGYILEAPFNKMLDEVHTFKISRLLPFLGLNTERILGMTDMVLDSTSNLQCCRKKEIIFWKK